MNLQFAPLPNCLLWSPNFVGTMFGNEKIYPPRPVNQAFQWSYKFYPPADGIYCDTTFQVIYLIEAGTISRIAGTWGEVGYRDGAPSQALFGMGGYYGTIVGADKDSTGNWYITDTRNGKIRKLTRATGWQVSTVAAIKTQALCVVNDDIWVTDDATNELVKISNGQQTRFPLSVSFQGIFHDQAGNLYGTSADGNYNVVWKIPAATGIPERFCGLNNAEVIALGGVVPIDGPVDHCTIHTSGPFWVADDGSEMFVGLGGDEVCVRRILSGRISTLQTDGSWQEVQQRGQGFQIGLSGGFGKDENGYPYVATPNGFSSFSKLVLADLQSTSGDGYVDSATEAGISGWAYTTGAPPPTVTLIIDNNPVASMVANLIRPDISYNNHQAGYAFSIPPIYGDGKPHTYGILRAGQNLNGSPKTFTFTTQGGNNMVKTVTLGYGNFTVPANETLANIKLDLLNPDSSVAQSQTVPAGATTATMTVGNGTGWRVQATNLDQSGAAIGSVAVSAPFDVQDTAIIQIVVGVTVS